LFTRSHKVGSVRELSGKCGATCFEVRGCDEKPALQNSGFFQNDATIDLEREPAIHKMLQVLKLQHVAAMAHR